MKNINLDNAKFGDKFVTKSNKLVLYLRKTVKGRHYLIGDEYLEPIPYNEQGKCFGDDEWDIISIYQEPTNEQKLNELAEQYEESLPESYTWSEYCDDDEGIHGVCSVCEIEKAFKAGYRKAKEG